MWGMLDVLVEGMYKKRVKKTPLSRGVGREWGIG